MPRPIELTRDEKARAMAHAVVVAHINAELRDIGYPASIVESQNVQQHVGNLTALLMDRNPLVGVVLAMQHIDP